MTTDRATLLGLADRCEKAGGPDGVLDRDIALAAGWRPAPNEYGDDTPWLIPPGQEVGPWVRHPPAFTASLDAALSLVMRAKCFIATISDIAADGLPGCCLCVSTDPVREVWGISFGGGSDPDERLARATTAAALRALAQEEQTDER